MNDPEFLRRLGGWVALALFLAVLLCSPPADMPPAAQRLAAVTLAMVVLWFSQALPLAVTALLPLAAYPLLAILPVKEVSQAYLDPAVFLFMGGFFIALAIEKWGLHRRMALHIVRAIGFGPRRVVFGFLLATAFLSMWISNTATTMLMLPIGLALLSAIEFELGPEGNAAAGACLSHLGRGLLLAIAYGASIGGLATPIGTPTNIAFRRFWESNPQFPGAPQTSTAEWMAVFVPVSVVLLLATGVVLTWRMPPLNGAERLERGFFRERLKELGPPRRQELTVFAVFLATAALWVLLKPLQLLVMQLGGTEAFAQGAVHDTVIAMGMATLLFCLPAGVNEAGVSRRLLDWETVESRTPWGMLLLIGGGFAVAEAFDATGLSHWVGARFEIAFHGAGTLALIVGVCVLATFLTELTTNVVLVNTLLPVLAAAAVSLRIDPRLLLIPATISASCAFMLPIATPPNAIVFSSGRISMRAMMSHGVLLNVIGIVVVVAATYALLVPVFGISVEGPPEWLPE